MRDGTAIPDTDTPAISRNFSRVDGKRAIIGIALFVSVGACYWFMLPVIQSKIIPHVASGPGGPWVLRPILPARFGAMAVMTSVTFPLIAIPLKRKWKHEDAAPRFHWTDGFAILMVKSPSFGTMPPRRRRYSRLAPLFSKRLSVRKAAAHPAHRIICSGAWSGIFREPFQV